MRPLTHLLERCVDNVQVASIHPGLPRVARDPPFTVAGSELGVGAPALWLRADGCSGGPDESFPFRISNGANFTYRAFPLCPAKTGQVSSPHANDRTPSETRNAIHGRPWMPCRRGK
jgi:hypothetical protein